MGRLVVPHPLPSPSSHPHVTSAPTAARRKAGPTLLRCTAFPSHWASRRPSLPPSSLPPSTDYPTDMRHSNPLSHSSSIPLSVHSPPSPPHQRPVSSSSSSSHIALLPLFSPPLHSPVAVGVSAVGAVSPATVRHGLLFLLFLLFLLLLLCLCLCVLSCLVGAVVPLRAAVGAAVVLPV